MASAPGTTTSAPNSMGIGPRSRRTKRRAPAPASQVGQGPWRDSSWVHSFSSQGPSPLGNPQDLNPAFALRKIVLLIEKQKFIDVSQLINQLNNVTIKSILHDLPMQMFLDGIPESLVALESLYSKLFILDPDNFPVEKLDVEATVFHIVRYQAMADSMLDNGSVQSNEETKKSITNILRIVLFVKPDIVSVVHARKQMMDNALHGIGEHSMVKVAGSLMNLHDGLKIEFEKTTVSYKTAIQQLEQLCLSNPKPVTLKSFANRSMPSANHQVLMTYTEAEIQDRLFKNKTVLNAVESNMTNQLPHLIQNLKDRIENDKNALLAFGRLRRELRGISGSAKVAPVLTQYSRSLRTVLDVFKVLLDEQFPESKTQGLNFPDQDDQVLKLEEVDGATPKENGLHAEGSNSTDLPNGIADGDIPPPPTHAPPPIPSPDSLTSPTSPLSPLSPTSPTTPPPPLENPQPSGKEARQQRGRSRRKKGTKSRATSLDRSLVTISRPERESVEDNRDFQMMMKRINSVSASSPVDREQTMESRRSSLSSSSEIHKPALNGQRPARPASMYVTGTAGTPSDDTYKMLMEESTKREVVEREKERMVKLHYETQTQLHKTQEDLRIALEQIARLQEKEKKLNQEITKLSSHPSLVNNNQSTAVRSKRNIVGDLLYEYDKLFTNQRAEAWMSLSSMAEQRQFEDSDDLKDKVLFSVIVLAFRTAKNTLSSIRGGVHQLLQVSHAGENSEGGGNSATNNQAQEKTEGELLEFLRRLGEGYDLGPLIKDVGKQLYSALYDYPKLKTSSQLGSFIERCVSLSWRLTIQDPPLTITYDSMTFNTEYHRRAPGTNRKATSIKSYLWPCLVEEHTGMCLYKGVVIT